jgi:hypothetical protein
VLAANLHCTLAEKTANSGCKGVRPMLMTILLVLLVLALLGGAFGQSRWGYAGWSPAGILVVILLIWLLFGNRV